MDERDMKLLEDAMDRMRQENARLNRELKSSEEYVSTLQAQLKGRMMTDRGALEQATAMAQIVAKRQQSLRALEKVLRYQSQGIVLIYFGVWFRWFKAEKDAKKAQRLELEKKAKEAKEARLERNNLHKAVKEEVETVDVASAPKTQPPLLVDSQLELMHEAHLERCRSLAFWAARKHGHLLAEKAQLRCFTAWRKHLQTQSRHRFAEWASVQLDRHATHGLLVYCFSSFRLFARKGGIRRPGTALQEEGEQGELPRSELSLLTPAALCRAVFFKNASRRLRTVTIWSAWRSATVDLRQERVAVALHSRFEQEHDLMDERVIFCRDAVVKEKLRGQSTYLLRWIFDAFMRSTFMGRQKARSLRKEEELQSMFNHAKNTMVQLSNAAVAILERMRRDPKPWTMKLIFQIWVLSTELSKEQLRTEGVQRRLNDALAEVALLGRRLEGRPTREESNPALDEFEAAGRAALSIYGPQEAFSRHLAASSSSSAYVSTDAPRVRLPKGSDFASTMAYLRETRKNPGAAAWDELAQPAAVSAEANGAGSVEFSGKSIGTNSGLWAQLDELDGFMAGMSGRFDGRSGM